MVKNKEDRRSKKTRIIVAIVLLGMLGWIGWQYYSTETEEKIAVTEKQEETGDIKIGLEKGDIAPDFELNVVEGDSLGLKELRGEKVLLNFWATWCPPCRAEMPDLQKLHEDEDIKIMAVNLFSQEGSIEEVKEFMEDYGVEFDVLKDENSEVSEEYKIQPIPTSYLINRDGTIHNVAYGALSYEEMVTELEKME